MTDAALPRTIGGFEILSRIAVGGMAEIYLARSRGYGGFEKRVVVKRLHDEYEGDPAFVQMLVDEARITAQLQHANIVQVMDLGVDHGRVFMAMELVDGRDLFQVLKELHGRQLVMPLEAACHIVAELALGLHFAHTRKDADSGAPLRIVHRDVSPQNVLLSWHGEVKLGDFGIVKAAMRSTETQAGVIKGKFYYMSPEQARGEPLDHRSDLFSAGIVLFEALTASPLYDDDDDVVLMDRVRNGRVESPRSRRPEIPPELDAICMRALAADRERRYPNALEFSRALTGFLASRGRAYGKADLADFLESLFQPGAPAAAGPELRNVDTDPELVPAAERPDDETQDGPVGVVGTGVIDVGPPRRPDAAAETVDLRGLVAPPPPEVPRPRPVSDPRAPVRSGSPGPDAARAAGGRAASPTEKPSAVRARPSAARERPPTAPADDENELTARLSRAEIAALNEKIIEDMKRRGTDAPALKPDGRKPDAHGAGASVPPSAYGRAPVGRAVDAVEPPPEAPGFSAQVDRRMRWVLALLVVAVVSLTATILWLVTHPVALPALELGNAPATERPPRSAPADSRAPPRGPAPAAFVEGAETATLVVRPAREGQRYKLYVDGELVVVTAHRAPLAPGRHTVEARLGDRILPPLEVEAFAGQTVDVPLPE